MFSHHADNPGHDDSAAAGSRKHDSHAGRTGHTACAGHGSGIHAGHGKGKGEQQQDGSGLGTGHHQAQVENDAANTHLNHGRIAVFDRNYKCYEQAGNQGGAPHHGHGVRTEGT